MVTFLILAAIVSVVVGIWLINKQQANDLKEINKDIHPFVDDLAPESTPAVEAEKIAKKKTTPKKKTAAKKSTTKKSTKK